VRVSPSQTVASVDTIMMALLPQTGTTPPKRQWGSRRRAIAMGLGMLDFGKRIADETEKWAKVIKSAGIKPV
jgi:hypothetical protein